MDASIVGIAEQLTSGGLIVILLAFAIYMIKRDENIGKKSNEAIKDNAVAMSKLSESIEGLTKMSEKNVAVLERNTHALEFLRDLDNFMRKRDA